MTTARVTAGALVLLALAGCSADETAPESEDMAAEIADAPSTGPYDVGDTIPAGTAFPNDARRETAERLASESDRDFVWVTDAYTIAEGGEVVETYYAVDGTGEVHERLAGEWATFDDPDEALDYAAEVVADVSDSDRYEVVPFDP